MKAYSFIYHNKLYNIYFKGDLNLKGYSKMSRKYEGIPKTLDPNPYYFDVFWQAVTKANKARNTLRKIYEQTHPNGEYIAPFGQAEIANTASDRQDQSNPVNYDEYAITHIKIMGRTINNKPDQPSFDPSTNL